jgi:O-acetyl-ADP-ribose deacetylase (regulator of RNase III)
MAITIHHGDLLRESDVDAIVNTVNCVGVMGKGIALQFKNKWPENFRAYQAACKSGSVRPGKLFVHDCGGLVQPRYIINFPTKNHWRGGSTIAYIRDGLVALVAEVARLGIRSIALPPLGCGNGGLAWSEVRPLIERTLGPLANVDVRLFEPMGSPPPKTMEVRTERPRMTESRAAILKVLETYGELGYGLSRIEVQKLAYFLQVAGEPLNLQFEKHIFGPYSDRLRHALNRLEGHFIRGVGDGDADAEIEPVADALAEAEQYLRARPESQVAQRVERVARLIAGFQSSYGMELLASVHWVATHERVRSAAEATTAVHAWNARKRSMMTARHVSAAWDQLSIEGWLPQNDDRPESLS